MVGKFRSHVNRTDMSHCIHTVAHVSQQTVPIKLVSVTVLSRDVTQAHDIGRGETFSLKFTKIHLAVGLCPDRWGAYSAPQSPQMDLRGEEPPEKRLGTREKRGWKGREKKRRGIKGGEGRENRGRGSMLALLFFPLQALVFIDERRYSLRRLRRRR